MRRRNAPSAPARAAARSGAEAAPTCSASDLKETPARARGFFRVARGIMRAGDKRARHERANMFAKQKPALALLAAAVLIAGCAVTSTREATAQALDNILADPHRSDADRARDRYRHPKDTLLFFGVRPEMTVLEVWPEPGWYTDIIAPLVRDRGKYYAAVMEPDPASQFVAARLDAFKSKLAADPTLYGHATIVTFPAHGGDVVPPGSIDLVVTFRNIHNWMSEGTASDAFATIFKALKPGGVLGVVEHRGNPALPQDPKAKSGYVVEDYAIKLIE